jgi:hypothetical protein
MIIAMSALFISIVTAGVSIYSAATDRAYAKASVWPRLEIFRSFSSNKSFEYGVTNNGTGPALIKYAKVKYDSKFIKAWRDIPNFEDFIQSHTGTRILPSQGVITPLKYKGENTKLFFNADKKISIELCYCSIYDECWVTDRSNQPTTVEQCIIDDKEKFLQ